MANEIKPRGVLAELDRRIEIEELFGQGTSQENLPGLDALKEVRAVVAELLAFVGNIATPYSEPLNSLRVGDIRRQAKNLVNRAGA